MSTPRARILPLKRLVQLANQLTVELVMTSDPKKLDERQTVQVGLDLLRQNEFDQAPVARGRVDVGLVYLEQLEAADPDAHIASVDYERLCLENALEPSSSLAHVLRKLVLRRSCVAVDEEDRVVGLVHFSDLNRQAMRSYCYLWHTAVEMAVGNWLGIHDPEARWLQYAPNRGKIRTEYRRLQLRRADTSYVELAYWTDLVAAIRNDERLHDLLIQDPVEDARLDRLTKTVRNRIMHPVEPLVCSHLQVKDLCVLLGFMQAVLKRLEPQLGMELQGGVEM